MHVCTRGRILVADAVCNRHSVEALLAECVRRGSASPALRGTVLVLAAAAVVRVAAVHVAAVRVHGSAGRHVPARELDSAQRPEARQHSGGEATHRVPRWHRQERLRAWCSVAQDMRCVVFTAPSQSCPCLTPTNDPTPGMLHTPRTDFGLARIFQAPVKALSEVERVVATLWYAEAATGNVCIPCGHVVTAGRQCVHVPTQVSRSGAVAGVEALHHSRGYVGGGLHLR